MRMRLSLLCLLCVRAVWCQSGDDETVSDVGECPVLVGLSDALESPLDVYLEPSDSQGILAPRVDLVSNGTVAYLIGDSLLIPLANILPSLSLHMFLPDVSDCLYFAVSVWSLTNTLAPPGCVSPRQGLLQPGVDTAISLSLSCNDVGSVTMQLCITVGTEPFSALNGTYRTFSLHLPLMCAGSTTSGCSVQTQDNVVPVEFCVTRTQTRELVEYGANGWGLLITSFADQDNRGFCLVDDSAENGISPVSRDAVARNLPIPEIFPGLDMYLEASRQTTSDAFSYTFEARVDNSSVLDDLFLELPTQPQGSSTERLYIRVLMPCRSPGFTKVNVLLNTTGFRDEIIYRRDYSLLFYRNCTPELNTTVIVIQSGVNLAVLVGVPVSLVIIVVITVTIITVLVAVMVHLTRRHKRKSYELEQRVELDLMSSSNAYASTNFKDPFEFLDEYNIEYNYASLEVVGSLGEGAFGRVFKAKAPGIHRGDYTPQEFVAVKTLKGGSGSDVLDAFRSEVKTCVRFEHPNVIRLVGVCTKTVQRCMIFEYMDLGGLGDLLRMSDPTGHDYPGVASDKVLLTPDVFLRTVIQVAHGLNYLASLKFIHRDVATRNCLVNHSLHVKIADFGMSRETNAMDYYRIGSAKAYLPVRWMPPEALLYGKFTVKSDVWSFGVLVWEVYTYGRQPYSGMSNYEVIDRVKTGQILDCPDLCPAPIYEVMKSSWTRVPSKRPTMDSIVNRMGKLLTIDGDGRVGESEGYMNMGFGVLASPEDMKEKRRVDVLLEEQERLNIINSCLDNKTPTVD